MMQQWYNCPKCNQYIQYGASHCAGCGCPLTWGPPQQQSPIQQHFKQVEPEKKNSKSLKAGLIVIGIIAVLFIGTYSICLNSSSKSSSTASTSNLDKALFDIKANAVGEMASKYIEIDTVEKESGYIRVYINLKYDPELYVNVEDGFKQAQVWTDAVAQNCVKILSSQGINSDVNVWGKMSVGKNEWILFGVTRYKTNTGAYTWERYKK